MTQSMTPQEIVSELDRHIVGQNDAKRAVAIALRSLDSNALAIELAAARAPRLGLSALQQRVFERLGVLHSPGAARPARQQSLRTTLH